MKTILFLLVVSHLLCSCNAIERAVERESVSLEMAVGKSGISGSESWEDPLGVQLGIGYKMLAFSEYASADVGIGISLQGANWSEPEYDLSGKVKLSYLIIPLLYQYQTRSGFYLETGLQPGFLLGAKDKFGGMTEDYKDAVKGFDLGLPVGIGYHINDHISVGVRSVYGLTNLDDTGSDVKDHNYVILGMIRITPNWLVNK